MLTKWQTGMTKLPVNSSCSDSHFWSCQGKARCLTLPRSVPRKVEFCTTLKEPKIYPHIFIWSNTRIQKNSVWISVGRRQTSLANKNGRDKKGKSSESVLQAEQHSMQDLHGHTSTSAPIFHPQNTDKIHFCLELENTYHYFLRFLWW